MARKHPPDDPAPPTPPLGTSTSTETGEIDPSHFGIYEFKPGLREELIRVEKPRLDPKLFQDTVPPNAKPGGTESDPVATTPRGGFVAPKPAVTTDLDAPTLVAPVTAKEVVPLAAPPSAPASTPPIDTSHSHDDLVIPTYAREGTYTRLVAAVAIVASIIVCIAIVRMRGGDPTPKAAEHAAAEDKLPRETASVAAPPVVQPQVEGVDRAPSAATTGTAPSSPAPAQSIPSTRRNVLDSARPARPATAATPRAPSKPAPASPKIRPEFDPGKPWSED